MKNRKKYLSLALALVMCLSLAACGKDGGSSEGSTTGVTPTRIDGMLKEEYDNTDYTSYLGRWDGVVNEGEDEQKLIVELNEDGEPCWELYVSDELTYCGFLQIRPQYENYVYAYNEYDGCGYMCWFDSYDVLHIEFDLNGYSGIFVPEGTVPGWVADAEADISEFADIAGVWYLDGEADALSSIEIDEYGNWTLYERPEGDGDPSEVDCGTISTGSEDGQYYATSTQFDDVTYDFTVAEDGVMYWGGEYDYYELLA